MLHNSINVFLASTLFYKLDFLPSSTFSNRHLVAIAFSNLLEFNTLLPSLVVVIKSEVKKDWDHFPGNLAIKVNKLESCIFKL